MKKNRLSKIPLPPCIDEKCLKFPVCKSKEKVQCEELGNYYHKLYPKHEADVIWTRICKSLPCLVTIQGYKVSGGYVPGAWRPVHHHQTPYGVKRSKPDGS